MMPQDVTAYRKGQFFDMLGITAGAPAERPIPQRWYVLQLYPMSETKVMRTFKRCNITGYVPKFTHTEVKRGRKVDVTRSLFEGLVFVPDYEFEQSFMSLLSIDGVREFLQFGDWIAWLSADAMAIVRHMADEGNIPLSAKKRLFAAGQDVRVVDGPFSGFSGQIEKLDNNGRLSVLVDLFKRMTHVELDVSQIEPSDVPTGTKGRATGAKGGHRRRRVS